MYGTCYNICTSKCDVSAQESKKEGQVTFKRAFRASSDDNTCGWLTVLPILLSPTFESVDVLDSIGLELDDEEPWYEMKEGSRYA